MEEIRVGFRYSAQLSPECKSLVRAVRNGARFGLIFSIDADRCALGFGGILSFVLSVLLYLTPMDCLLEGAIPPPFLLVRVLITWRERVLLFLVVGIS